MRPACSKSVMWLPQVGLETTAFVRPRYSCANTAPRRSAPVPPRDWMVAMRPERTASFVAPKTSFWMAAQ